jgi:hypothetical protein
VINKVIVLNDEKKGCGGTSSFLNVEEFIDLFRGGHR